MNYLRSIRASAYAATISLIATIALTLISEFSVAFKTWLASFTGHHWVSKSWVSIFVFTAFFFIFRAANKSPDSAATNRALTVLEWAIIIGFFVILGFFSYEFFGA